LILENKFAIGSSDKNVAICYYETEQRFWAAEMIKKKPKSTVTCIAWHPNNQLLAVGSCDYRCRSVKNAHRVKTLSHSKSSRCRIYTAYIKEVDKEPKASGWGKITNAGDLLHEFQSGSS
jgi:actin related protein 2/3 complex, subunit 1A/1B